jgi:DNA-binding response OmpR family regulator
VPRHILIAEDHAELRDVLSDYLRAEGYVVGEAANGASALDAARIEAPDVLVLDLNMPGVDGAQLLREWSASSLFSGVPVLLVSASPELFEIAQRFGVKATLTKPFDMDEFGAVVHALVHHPELPK